MATVTYTQLNQRRDRALQRTAPPIAKRTSAVKDDEGRHRSAPQPSKLQQMQAKYQQKLMKEKEDKLIAIHQKSQDQADVTLQRLKGPSHNPGRSAEKKGVVREFFKERRQMDKDGRTDLLPPGSHLQKMRSEQLTLYQQERQKQEELKNYANRQKQSQIKPSNKQQGYNRSKPLAPIKQQSAERIDHPPHHPPLRDSHYETSERLVPGEENEQQKVFTKKPKRAPLSFQGKSNSDGPIVRKQHAKAKGVTNYDANRNNINATPPRKPLPKVAAGKRNKTPSYQRERTPKKESNELSEFQKWQNEQDEQREVRLQKYQEKLKVERRAGQVKFDVSRDDDEFEGEKYYDRVDRDDAHGRRRQEYDDMLSKEKELERMIAKHQEELKKLQAESVSDQENSGDDGTLDTSYNSHQIQKKPTVQKTVGRKGKKIPYPPADDYEKYEDRYGYEDKENEINRRFDPSQHIEKEEDSRDTRKTKPETSKQRQFNSSSGQQSQTQRSEFREETSLYLQAASGETDQTSDLDLRPCDICGRSFAADRLPKHKSICKKSSNIQRKVFDSTKHRTDGTDMSQFVRNDQHLKETKKVSQYGIRTF